MLDFVVFEHGECGADVHSEGHVHKDRQGAKQVVLEGHAGHAQYVAHEAKGEHRHAHQKDHTTPLQESNSNNYIVGELGVDHSEKG